MMTMLMPLLTTTTANGVGRKGITSWQKKKQ